MDNCGDFQEKFEQSLSFLFDEKGFRVERLESSTRDRCLAILSNDRFKIKLYRADHEINILFGELSAPDIWGEDEDGRTHWHYCRSIAGFLRWDLDFVLPSRKEWREMTPERQLRDQAESLREVYSEVEALFSGGGFEKRKGEFEEYDRLLSEKIMQAYDSRSSKAR